MGHRKKRLQSAGVPTCVGLFDELTVAGKLEEQWLISWIVTNSDFDIADIIAAKDFDADAVYLLFQFATQIPYAAKLPAEARSKEFHQVL